MKRGGAVECAILRAYRQPDNAHDVHRFRFVQQPRQTLLGFVQQQGVAKQVGAGVGGQSQFGENDYLHARGFGLAEQIERLLCIEAAIGHFYRRNGGRHLDESEIFHDF